MNYLMNYREIIIRAANRAMFVSCWADYEENVRGTSFSGCELMDVAPATPNNEALSNWIAEFERKNKESIDQTFIRAIAAHGQIVPNSRLAEKFGHYMAMQGAGHGVSWFDDFERFEVTIPHMECFWDGSDLTVSL